MSQESSRPRPNPSRGSEGRDWKLPEPLDSALLQRFAAHAGVIPEVAAVLLRRGDGDVGKALSLLTGSPGEDELPQDFMGIPGMAAAVRRVERARETRERVVVYSDFDCDGVTSAVVLKEALESAGFDDFAVYFPSRLLEGYGFHAESALDLAGRGASLFVTADCGISAHEACEALAQCGVDVIITDHHLPGSSLPRAVSVLDPHLPEWGDLGLRGLSGAGVAYLLARAFLTRFGIIARPTWAHDLLTLSIAGDGQPVLGLNRYWIRSGLRAIADGERTGVWALLQVSGLGSRGEDGGAGRVSFDRDVLFGLVPRINAAGRLGDPMLAFELLSTGDPERAEAISRELDQLNRQRREIEDRILGECAQMVSGDGHTVSACRPGWHEGVIGIACSRLRESYGKPCVLIGGDGDVLKGSARGIPGFNVVSALERCRDYLETFGGHEGAGGFSIRKDAVDAFLRAFDLTAGEALAQVPPQGGPVVDELLAMSRVNDETLRAFHDLGPFGEGNPLPLMACMGCEVTEIAIMGSSQDHLRVTLARDGVSQRFLWFRRRRAAREIALWSKVDALFNPYRDVYRGTERFSPLLRDMRPSWESSGFRYASLAREIPRGKPVVLYTWSDEAAESIWIAFRKEGRAAALHKPGLGKAGERAARSTMLRDGVVVSTAPWELGWLREENERPADLVVMLAHPPATHQDSDALQSLLSKDVKAELVGGALRDAETWLSWSHPEKDRMRPLWKLLTQSYPGGRVPLWELGGRWREALDAAGLGGADACPEGGRLYLASALKVFEETGLLAYEESRRMPELVLRTKAGKVDLGSSPFYVAGVLFRVRAEELLRKGWTE